jgi:mono/diheme cytochrome c family protein
MKKAIIIGSILLFVLGLALFAEEQQTTQANGSQGKAAFLSNKCNMCHSVESEKIEKSSGGYQKSTDKNVPPDLSGIGKKQNAEWFAKYIKKTEALNGVKHAKAYRGTEEELQAIAKWLEGLK